VVQTCLEWIARLFGGIDDSALHALSGLQEHVALLSVQMSMTPALVSWYGFCVWAMLSFSEPLRCCIYFCDFVIFLLFCLASPDCCFFFFLKKPFFFFFFFFFFLLPLFFFFFFFPLFFFFFFFFFSSV